jgi:hypothetical protein
MKERSLSARQSTSCERQSCDHYICSSPSPDRAFSDLYVAINFGILNAFFAAFPDVFHSQYQFNFGSIGLTFLGQVVGSIAGFLIIIIWDHLRYQPLQRNLSQKDPPQKLSPEERLVIAMIGAPLLPISLFCFGRTARPSIPWISRVCLPERSSAAGTCSSSRARLCIQQIVMEPKFGASVRSLNTFLRYLFATVFAMFVNLLYRNLGSG